MRIKRFTPLYIFLLQTPVKLPNNLKKHILDWSEREKIWLNITHFPWPEDRVCKHYSVQFDKTRRIPVTIHINLVEHYH